MLLDEKGKLFGKVSIVDIGVLLLVAALLAGIYFRYFAIDKHNNAAKFDTLEYTVVLAEGVRQQSVDAIIVGADIYDVKTDTPMGKIVGKEVSPAVEQLTKADGTVVWAEKPERFNVRITIQVPGIETKYGFRANGRLDINRDQQQVLDTQMIVMETRVVDVKNLSKAQ